MIDVLRIIIVVICLAVTIYSSYNYGYIRGYTNGWLAMDKAIRKILDDKKTKDERTN